MVCIQSNFVILDFFNCQNMDSAVWALCLDLHSHFDFSSFLELALGDGDHLGGIILAVGFLGLYCHRYLLSLLFPMQLFFEPWNNHSCTDNELKRVSVLRSIEYSPLVIFQCVVH